jgi:hypothetical protein
MSTWLEHAYDERCRELATAGQQTAAILDEAHRLRDERDALLAALQRIVACDEHDPDGLRDTWKDLTYRCMAIAREAIAEATGGRSTENGAPVQPEGLV